MVRATSSLPGEARSTGDEEASPDDPSNGGTAKSIKATPSVGTTYSTISLVSGRSGGTHGAILSRCGHLAQVSIRAITRSPGPHEESVWSSASHWVPAGCAANILSHSAMSAYLAGLNYCATEPKRWEVEPGNNTQQSPVLTLTLPGVGDSDNAHEEHAGHTWYLVDCSVGPRPQALPLPTASLGDQGKSSSPGDGAARIQSAGASVSKLAWRSPRRLSQLRDGLHDPVKEALGDRYYELFGRTPFAKRGGMRGTTARLRDWLVRLADVVNAGGLVPETVAALAVFLRAPEENDCVPEEEGSDVEEEVISSLPNGIKGAPEADDLTPVGNRGSFVMETVPKSPPPLPPPPEVYKEPSADLGDPYEDVKPKVGESAPQVPAGEEANFEDVSLGSTEGRSEAGGPSAVTLSVPPPVVAPAGSPHAASTKRHVTSTGGPANSPLAFPPAATAGAPLGFSDAKPID